MTDPLLGTVSIAAAFFAGILALLAPCCITFLLPSYLAAGIQQGRWRLLRMTLLFSAGLAAVLLPIAWGVAGLGQLVPQWHREIFFLGGILLLGLGTLALSGRWSLPMPWSPDLRGRGGASVFALGAFSGAASSCCAPVLAGVLALSLVAPSWWLGLAVGVSYVFGMVFPLLLVAILGQRFDLLSHRALRPRQLRLQLGPWRPVVTSTNLVAAMLLWSMGIFVLWLGATGESAYAPPFLQDAYLGARGLFDELTVRMGAAGVLAVAGAAALVIVLGFALRPASRPVPVQRRGADRDADERWPGDPAPHPPGAAEGALPHAGSVRPGREHP